MVGQTFSCDNYDKPKQCGLQESILANLDKETDSGKNIEE